MTRINSTITPASPNEEGLRFFETLKQQREEGVRRILEKVPTMPVIAAVMQDIEMSPRSTNRLMLLAIGVPVPAEMPVGPEQTESFIRTVVGGLAAWNIFVKGTNGLTDEMLAETLFEAIDDDVMTIPPCEDMCEFLDFSDHGGADVCERDQFLPKRVDQRATGE
jgi:hypothetical protein